MLCYKYYTHIYIFTNGTVNISYVTSCVVTLLRFQWRRIYWTVYNIVRNGCCTGRQKRTNHNTIQTGGERTVVVSIKPSPRPVPWTWPSPRWFVLSSKSLRPRASLPRYRWVLMVLFFLLHPYVTCVRWWQVRQSRIWRTKSACKKRFRLSFTELVSVSR